MPNLPLTPLGGARGRGTLAHQAAALSRSPGPEEKAWQVLGASSDLGQGLFFLWEVSMLSSGD